MSPVDMPGCATTSVRVRTGHHSAVEVHFRIPLGQCKCAISVALVTSPDGHVVEVHLWVLVHDAHDLCCVHWGPSAPGDDDVRLEPLHGASSFAHCLEGGISLDVREELVLDAVLRSRRRNTDRNHHTPSGCHLRHSEQISFTCHKRDGPFHGESRSSRGIWARWCQNGDIP